MLHGRTQTQARTYVIGKLAQSIGISPESSILRYFGTATCPRGASHIHDRQHSLTYSMCMLWYIYGFCCFFFFFPSHSPVGSGVHRMELAELGQAVQHDNMGKYASESGFSSHLFSFLFLSFLFLSLSPLLLLVLYDGIAPLLQ